MSRGAEFLASPVRFLKLFKGKGEMTEFQLTAPQNGFAQLFNREFSLNLGLCRLFN